MLRDFREQREQILHTRPLIFFVLTKKCYTDWVAGTSSEHTKTTVSHTRQTEKQHKVQYRQHANVYHKTGL